MKKYAVFTNYGNWDADAMGFVGFIDADPSSALATAITTFHEEKLPTPLDANQIAVVVGQEEIEKVYEEYELSFYVDPDFTVFGIYKVSHYSDMIIGLIEVPS